MAELDELKKLIADLTTRVQAAEVTVVNGIRKLEDRCTALEGKAVKDVEVVVSDVKKEVKVETHKIKIFLINLEMLPAKLTLKILAVILWPGLKLASITSSFVAKKTAALLLLKNSVPVVTPSVTTSVPQPGRIVKL